MKYSNTENDLRDKSLYWWTNLPQHKMVDFRNKWFPSKGALTADERLLIYKAEHPQPLKESDIQDDEMRRAYQIADQQDWESKTGSYAETLKEDTPNTGTVTGGEGLAKWYLIPTSFKPIGELREVIIAEMEVTADLTKGREFDSPTSLFLRGENDRLKIENQALKERVKELEKQVKPKIYY